MRVWLLLAGVVAPVIYVALALGGPLLWPGYDPARQFVSELGMAQAPHHTAFNIALMATGGLTALFGLGLFLDLRRRGAGWISSTLTGLTIALFGAGVVIGGLFPLPDPRHGAWNIGLAVQFAPLLALLALRKAAGLTGLKVFLGVLFVANNVVLAVLFGVGDLVNSDNLGLWQRAYGLMFIWTAVTALTLMATPARQGR